jgi:head-tail adaptor
METELSGALKERVAIETFVDARDAAGASVGFWAAAGSAWALVSPDGAGGAEGEARRSRRRWRVILRAPVRIGLTSRLVWRGQWLSVLSVLDDPRRPDRVELRCEVQP